MFQIWAFFFENSLACLGLYQPFKYIINTPLRLLGQALAAPALVGEPLQTLLFQILETIFLDIENIKILICRCSSTFTSYHFAVFSMKIRANLLALLHFFQIATLRCRKCVAYTIAKSKNELKPPSDYFTRQM